jgi:DNA-binding MarR family transcriptional regulator
VDYNKDMKNNGLQDNLYWLFLKASFRSKRGFIKIADKYELTVVQLYTLVQMKPHHPLPMNMIADVLACDPSNVTGIIDRLFSQHYIERQEKPTDRRVKMISLTPKGEQLQKKVIKDILAYQSDVLEKLTKDQRDQLRDLLKQILENSK